MPGRDPAKGQSLKGCVGPHPHQHEKKAMPRQLPCEELCLELVELGIPPERHTREELWRIVAERWKTSAPIPFSMTVDQLASTAIELLRAGEKRP